MTARSMADLATMACVACQVAIPAGSRFCMQCGARQTHPCAACDGDLPLGVRLCDHCGQPQV